MSCCDLAEGYGVFLNIGQYKHEGNESRSFPAQLGIVMTCLAPGYVNAGGSRLAGQPLIVRLVIGTALFELIQFASDLLGCSRAYVRRCSQRPN